MANRIKITAIALFGATALGLMAPDASTELFYRLVLIGFVLLSIVYRIISMGIIFSFGPSDDFADCPPSHVRNAGRANGNDPLPLFVKDPSVTLTTCQ